MFASLTSHSQALHVSLAQVVGITAPAIYSSLTFAYSHMVIPPIVAHAPPKILAKQWLQAYQQGPTFVPPLIISGAISNILLAYWANTWTSKVLYTFAAVLVWSTMPVTLLYFEPGINGAGKWKVQQMLRDEGFVMRENESLFPYVDRHTGKSQARTWAESVEMKDIALEWARLNAQRYVVTGIAVVLSAVATCFYGRL